MLHLCIECEDEMYAHSKLTKTENIHTSVCMLFDTVTTSNNLIHNILHMNKTYTQIN